MDIKNRPVTHKRYGRGKIIGLQNDALTILFQQYGTRTFRYPKVFEEDLSTEDAELSVIVEQALLNAATQRKE